MKRVALALLLLSSGLARAESEYTQKMFRHAMSKDNMAISGSMGLSPLYVLIRLRERSGRDRTICTGSGFLEGAIHTEYNLPYNDAGQRRAFEIVMSQPNRTFTFAKRKALENVKPAYTEEQVARVRERLAKKTRAQLRAETNSEDSETTHLYRRINLHTDDFWVSESWQGAVAQVLLERGVLVGWAHGTGALYAEK